MAEEQSTTQLRAAVELSSWYESPLVSALDGTAAFLDDTPPIFASKPRRNDDTDTDGETLLEYAGASPNNPRRKMPLGPLGPRGELPAYLSPSRSSSCRGSQLSEQG
jgi:hypothetical protein